MEMQLLRSTVLAILFLALPGVAAEQCTVCHQEFMARFRHLPALQENCIPCHAVDPSHLASGDKAGVTIVYDSVATCLTCHEEPGFRAMRHAAMDMEKECSTCHEPHGASVAFHLKKEPEKLCFDCHASVPKSGTSKHGGRVAGFGCVDCHEPHSSPWKNLVRAPGTKLCVMCHSKDIHKGDERVIRNIKNRIESEFSGWHGEQCLTCHTPHPSPNNFILKDGDFPYTSHQPYRADDYDACFTCHSPELVNKNTPGATRFRNDVASNGSVESKNLHWAHVVGERVPKYGRSCRICHDTHGGQQGHLLNTTLWPYLGIPFKFEQTADGGNCATACHISKPKRYNRR